MEYPDTEAQAAGHAAEALSRMAQHGVPANPNNFAIWYAFVSDRFPDLTYAVQGVLQTGQPFSAETCRDIYDRFFGSAAEEEELRQAGQRIEEALGKLIDFMGTAKQGASNYSDALQSFTGRLKGGIAAGGNDLGAVVQAILHETRSMADVNKQLETRLQSSAQEVAKMRQDMDELRREATTDALTNIANRKAFDVTLREAAVRAQENGQFLCLLMIDIDFFKKFNDAHGHQLGDQVLKLVAKCMTDCVKGQDTAARYGGEEFSVILPGTALRDAVKVGDAIRNHVAGKKIVNRRNNQNLGQITLSIGVAEYALGEPLGQFIHRADEALYLAKRMGRNRVLSQEDMARANQLEVKAD